jgi:hypothetical protein
MHRRGCIQLEWAELRDKKLGLIYIESLPRWLVVIRPGIFKKSKEARNRVGIGLSYRPARPHRLVEFIPWNQFLGSINV